MAKKLNEVVPADDSEKKSSRKWPIIVLMVALCLSALAGGLVVSMGTESFVALLSGGMETPASEESHGVEVQDDVEPSNASLVVDPLKEIIVNITSITETGRKRSRFLKLNLALVFDEHAEGAEHVLERKVYIRDAFQNYLRQLTERDLSGTIGIVRLKSELLRRARAVTESEAPHEVLISDIIVQ